MLDISNNIGPVQRCPKQIVLCFKIPGAKIPNEDIFVLSSPLPPPIFTYNISLIVLYRWIFLTIYIACILVSKRLSLLKVPSHLFQYSLISSNTICPRNFQHTAAFQMLRFSRALTLMVSVFRHHILIERKHLNSLVFVPNDRSWHLNIFDNIRNATPSSFDSTFYF